MLKSTFAIFAVAATMLATAGPAGAAIAYNGHAGLGASVYQHNQTDLEFITLSHISDGTSNTIAFGEVIAMPDMGGQYY